MQPMDSSRAILRRLTVAGGLLLLSAEPTLGQLINGSFEDGLNGWETLNVRLNPDAFLPSPAFLDGTHRAGYADIFARDSYGRQLVAVPGRVALTGGLAGGSWGGPEYWVRLWDGPARVIGRVSELQISGGNVP